MVASAEFFDGYSYLTIAFDLSFAKFSSLCHAIVVVLGVITGVYITNEPDACLYQATHAEAEVVVCDSIDRLRRFTVNLKSLPKVKAFVVWGVDSLPEEFSGPMFYLWKDFLASGSASSSD